MDYNRDLRIVRTKENTYPLPYKNNVIWIHHDKNKEPIAEVWDHGRWVPLTGALAGSAVIGDIPEGVKTNGTSQEFFESLMNEFSRGNIGLNGFFQGQVNMSDLPTGLNNAEATIQVIKGLNGDPIFNVELTTTSYYDNLSPYRWDYSSRGGKFGQWYPRAIGDNGGNGADETIYLDNSDESKSKNLEVTAKYSTNQSIPIIVTNNNGLKCIGNYFNGTVTFVVDGALKIEDVSFKTGETSSFASVDIDKLEEYTHLEIGDSAEVKSFNLEQLKTGPQMVSIDYGFGVASWNSSTGGDAHITTANGHEVYYTIGIDGTVTKNGEITKDSIVRELTYLEGSAFNRVLNGFQLTQDEIIILSKLPRVFTMDGLMFHSFIDDDFVYMSNVGLEENDMVMLTAYVSNEGKPTTHEYSIKYDRPAKSFTDDSTITLLKDTEYQATGSVISKLTIKNNFTIKNDNGGTCYVYFKTGDTAPTITLPTVKWANNDVPSFKANKGYELNFKLVNFAGAATLIGAYAEYTL